MEIRSVTPLLHPSSVNKVINLGNPLERVFLYLVPFFYFLFFFCPWVVKRFDDCSMWPSFFHDMRRLDKNKLSISTIVAHRSMITTAIYEHYIFGMSCNGITTPRLFPDPCVLPDFILHEQNHHFHPSPTGTNMVCVCCLDNYNHEMTAAPSWVATAAKNCSGFWLQLYGIKAMQRSGCWTGKRVAAIWPVSVFLALW